MERLTRRLNKGLPIPALKSYLTAISKWGSANPVIYIDDSDVVKPDGYKFELLWLVRDRLKSTDTKNVYEKGYHVTEACVLIKNSHPVSIFSKIHFSKEKDYTSVNDITFAAVEWGAAMFGKATFAMDRGYDDNKMFLKLDQLQQDYVIRLTIRQKPYFHGKWMPATKLRNQRKDIYLVLVYGITEHPMMLAKNKKICSKEDVIKVATLYFPRWRIEEYFRCKKFAEYGREASHPSTICWVITVLPLRFSAQ